MFNFIVFHPGMLFGRPELHVLLECEDVGVCYVVMFTTDGRVYSNVGSC